MRASHSRCGGRFQTCPFGVTLAKGGFQARPHLLVLELHLFTFPTITYDLPAFFIAFVFGVLFVAFSLAPAAVHPLAFSLLSFT